MIVWFSLSLLSDRCKLDTLRQVKFFISDLDVEIVLKQKTRAQLVLHLMDQSVNVLSLALNSAVYLIIEWETVPTTTRTGLFSHHGQFSTVRNPVDNGL